MRRQPVRPIWLAASLLLLAGCATPYEAPVAAPPAEVVEMPAPEGRLPVPGDYLATFADATAGELTNLDLQPITARIAADGQVQLFAGCNHFFATFAPDGTIPEAGATEMLCEGNTSEPVLHEALATARFTNLDDDRFQIGNLVFAPGTPPAPQLPDRPPDGTYDVSLEQTRGDVVSFTTLGTGTIVGDDVQFDAGCNTIIATIGADLVLTMPISTRIYCEGNETEPALLAALDANRQIVITGVSDFSIGELRFTQLPAPTSVSATWRVDPEAELAPESTVVPVLVSRIECNNGVTGEIVDHSASTLLDENAIRIEFWVGPVNEGEANCPDNDEVPFDVELPEPLGNQVLIDGVCGSDANVATTIWCQTDVRWDPEHGIVESTWDMPE